MSTAPVVICAAVTGSITDRSVTPHVPMTTEEIVTSSVEAWEAGAAVIHLHARDDDGRPSFAKERFAALVDGIRARGCDAVLNLSTGSGGGTFRRGRALRVPRSRAGHGLVRLRVDELQRLGLRERAAVPGGHGGGVRPQRRRSRRSSASTPRTCRTRSTSSPPGVLREPLHFQFVLGVRGGAPATLAQVAHHARDAPGRRDLGRLRHRARAAADEPRRARLRRPRADGAGGQRYVPPRRARGQQPPARRARRAAGGESAARSPRRIRRGRSSGCVPTPPRRRPLRP